ncbi:putative membrane protein [Candidatus Accumulibacter aalborgensis]|uniref:Putative membrane protein n=1 Tax=Candidatus Accumulibacter aalborgensis TaxID=1860102 RepID=A0A1A8XMN0_9PROT|nr:DUF1269 domain-containing protein [Candidatus Accumulibacter aalborgensis]SBT06429.1 putative membrane protein [Candidatus Accumulibacter aalborgensis]
MSKLVVIAYDSANKAAEVRSRLRTMQKDQTIDLDEALVAVKDEEGEVSLLQTYKPIATEAPNRGFWNSLVGLILMNPVLGMSTSRRANAVGGALTEVGVDQDFLKDLTATFQNGTSVLFALVREASTEKVLAELRGTGGKLLETTLTHAEEARLQAALDCAG